MAVPIRRVKNCWPESNFLNSNRMAPRIAGIERRKENFPESSRSRPQKSPVEMVAPDREIPGMIANPWAIPIMRASIHPIFPMFLSSFFAQRVNQRTNPVTISITPTNLGLEKKDSNQSFRKIPMRPVGRVASTIQSKSFASS